MKCFPKTIITEQKWVSVQHISASQYMRYHAARPPRNHYIKPPHLGHRRGSQMNDEDEKTSFTPGWPASLDLFRVAQEKSKQNCVGWYNCQQVCKSGNSDFHKHCCGCCKAAHPSQEENCSLREGHSPHNLGGPFFSFGLLRDFSLRHMPSHYS